MAVAFIGLFSPPVLGPSATIGWMMITYFLLATVYSLFAVPYTAIPSENTIPEAMRGRLVAWRMLVAMIGILVGAGLVPQIVEFSGGGRRGYHRMSLLIAAACFAAMLLPLWMLRGRDLCASDLRMRATVWGQFGAVLRHRRFVVLTCAYVLQLTAVGIVSASAPYLVTGALHRSEGEIGTAMLGMLGATTLSIPLWAWAARRYSAPQALISAILVFGLGAIAIGGLAVAYPSWPSSRIAFALAGLGFAGMQVLPYTIVASLIHSAVTHGAAGESSFTGMWTAAEKVGLALGPAMTGLALAASQDHKIRAISLLVIFAPLTLGLLSLPLLIAATKSRAA
jgi:Na+/melibiose symporter-like transporter